MDRTEHLRWMSEAMPMAEEALAAGEVPVGCVFVRDGRLIAKARNRTNELCNVKIDYIYFSPLLTAPSTGHTTRRTRSHR